MDFGKTFYGAAGKGIMEVQLLIRDANESNAKNQARNSSSHVRIPRDAGKMTFQRSAKACAGPAPPCDPSDPARRNSRQDRDCGKGCEETFMSH